MSDKKRTTVTTIETHEIWIIRRAMPELPDVEATDAITVTTPVSPSDVSIDTRPQAPASLADGLGDNGQSVSPEPDAATGSRPRCPTPANTTFIELK